jgi:hypothetical protein
MPVDKRSIVELIERSLRVIALDAMFADMFVLIVAILVFPISWPLRQPGAGD